MVQTCRYSCIASFDLLYSVHVFDCLFQLQVNPHLSAAKSSKYHTWHSTWIAANVSTQDLNTCDRWLTGYQTGAKEPATKRSTEEFLGRQRRRYITTSFSTDTKWTHITNTLTHLLIFYVCCVSFIDNLICSTSSSSRTHINNVRVVLSFMILYTCTCTHALYTYIDQKHMYTHVYRVCVQVFFQSLSTVISYV